MIIFPASKLNITMEASTIVQQSREEAPPLNLDMYQKKSKSSPGRAEG